MQTSLELQCYKVSKIRNTIGSLSDELENTKSKIRKYSYTETDGYKKLRSWTSLSEKEREDSEDSDVGGSMSEETLEKLEQELSALSKVLNSINSILNNEDFEPKEIQHKPMDIMTPNENSSTGTSPEESLRKESSPIKASKKGGSDLSKRHRRGHRPPRIRRSLEHSDSNLEKEKLLCELETLYDKTPIGLCLVDDTLRFIRVNHMMSSITNVDIYEHYGKTVREIIPDHAEILEDIYREVFFTGMPKLDVELTTTKNGHTRCLLLSCYPISFPDSNSPSPYSPEVSPFNNNYTGTPTSSPSTGLEGYRPRSKVHAVASVVKDISELKQKEADLIAEKRRVEEANQAKSKFLAHMSHELRTPMACILGMVNFLTEAELTYDQQECVTAIQQNASSLLQILNDILDLTKVEAGRIVLDPSPFDAVAVLDKVAEIFAYKVCEKKLQLVLKIDPGMHQMYIGDPVRIRQILWNLVGNSVKFTDYGHIQVELVKLPRSVPNNSDKINNGLLLKVADTGIGIPEDQIPGIFNEFNQADNSASRAYSGTGLGLAIVDRLVHMMGGEIVLESKVNVGSTFSLYLPFESAPKSPTVSDMSLVKDVKELALERPFRWFVVSSSEVIRSTVVEYLNLCNIHQIEFADKWSDLSTQFTGVGNSPNTKFCNFIVDASSSDEAQELSTQISKLMPTSQTLVLLSFTEKPKLKIQEVKHTRWVVKPIRLTNFLETLADSLASSIKPDRVSKERKETFTASPPMVPKSFPNLRILVVEDNSINQTILTRILKKMMCECVEAAKNGREAVECVTKKHYDLIFMDLQMPILDGYAATIEIRNNEKETGGHVPIIAVTAHAMATDKERCLQVGMDDYVTKPIEASQVQNILTKLTNGEYTDSQRQIEDCQ